MKRPQYEQKYPLWAKVRCLGMQALETSSGSARKRTLFSTNFHQLLSLMRESILLAGI